jgi:hypothetical protein
MTAAIARSNRIRSSSDGIVSRRPLRSLICFIHLAAASIHARAVPDGSRSNSSAVHVAGARGLSVSSPFTPSRAALVAACTASTLAATNLNDTASCGAEASAAGPIIARSVRTASVALRIRLASSASIKLHHFPSLRRTGDSFLLVNRGEGNAAPVGCHTIAHALSERPFAGKLAKTRVNAVVFHACTVLWIARSAGRVQVLSGRVGHEHGATDQHGSCPDPYFDPSGPPAPKLTQCPASRPCGSTAPVP